jgi:hypothetical protein
MTTTAHGVWRGLQQVSYSRNQYRAVVKNEAREPVFVSTKIQPMREAIRETDALAKHWKQYA